MREKPCGFEPSVIDPAICRYYYVVGEVECDPICVRGDNMKITCPYKGRNPYPQEEDSYE